MPETVHMIHGQLYSWWGGRCAGPPPPFKTEETPMPPLFEITFWSGAKTRLKAFDVVGARALAGEVSDEPILKIEKV
jgi:hypothetical protein